MKKILAGVAVVAIVVLGFWGKSKYDELTVKIPKPRYTVVRSVRSSSRFRSAFTSPWRVRKAWPISWQSAAIRICASPS